MAVLRSTARRPLALQGQALSSERGAAMIIVIAIMTILLAIALTFYTMSRVELQSATNVTNSVRNELLGDAVNSIAIAHLNQDFFRNPEATSTDHSWRSIFNGAWSVGKPWTRRNGVALSGGGIPEINLAALDRAALGPNDRLYVVFEDGHREPLFRGPRTTEWLFIPRWQPSFVVIYDDTVTLEHEDPSDSGLSFDAVNASLASNGAPELRYYTNNRQLAGQFPERYVFSGNVPFVTPDIYGAVRDASGSPVGLPTPANDNELYPDEQIAQWADVDVDGNGLRDAVWVPLPSDKFYAADGADNNLNGLVDEVQDNDTGILDEDGDGQANTEFVRQSNGEFTVGDNGRQVVLQPDRSPKYDIDEAIEPGIFVYYGGNDGLDNDGDGRIDQEDNPDTSGNGIAEFSASDPLVGYFLTAPLPGIMIPVDFNADGVAGDLVYAANGTDGLIGFVPLMVRMPTSIRVSIGGAFVTLTEANVDSIDNDYDLIINDYYTYAYVGPNSNGAVSAAGENYGPPFRLSGFDDNQGVPSPRFNDLAVNSVISPQFGGTSVYPANFYEQWQHPGNWAVSAGPSDGDDKRLFSVARKRVYTDINLDAVIDTDGNGRYNELTYVPSNIVISGLDTMAVSTLIGDAIRISHSGEPSCDLVGRAAIYIADEGSKVNLNTAGAHQVRDRYDATRDEGPLARSLAYGASPREYETRALPDVGVAGATFLSGFRTGAPGGISLPVDPSKNFAGDGNDEEYNVGNFLMDISTPGYGRTDDNGNALLLSLNGIDDDGDGLIDEGIFLPEVSQLTKRAIVETGYYQSLVASGAAGAPLVEQIKREIVDTRYLEYYSRLGLFEGIDEPGELQTFSPLRNEIAEGRRPRHLDVNDPDSPAPETIADNDQDQVNNEFGELGDRSFTDRQQMLVDGAGGVAGVGPVTYANLKNITSTFSTDRSISVIPERDGIRGLNRLDYNYSTPQQIVANLLLSNPEATPVTDRLERPDQLKYDDGTSIPMWRLQQETLGSLVGDQSLANLPRLFAQGLLQGDVSLTAPALGNGYARSVADEVFPANNFAGGMLFGHYQSAASVVEPSTFFFPADPILRAMQNAVDIVDSRDRDHKPSSLSTEYGDLYDNPDDDLNDAFYNYPKQNDIFGVIDPPEDTVLPLEEIQQKLAEVFDGARNLQFVDRWWRRFAGDDPDVSGLDNKGENRPISYTVRGKEAIKINEIMVRPVRRIEAEATPNSTSATEVPEQSGTATPLYDPITTPPTPIRIQNFDPSPFGDSIAAVSADSITPEFRLRRHIYEGDGSGLGFSDWKLDGGYIGNLSSFVTTRRSIEIDSPAPSAVVVPDAMEFLIYSTSGLPPGRYYLAANTMAALGAGDVTTADDANDLEYSIKYVPVDAAGNPLMDTIMQDMLGRVAATLPAGLIADYNLDPYIQERWSKLSPDYVSGDVGDATFKPGAAPGWVFIDGNPYGAVNGWDNVIRAMHEQNGYFLPGDIDNVAAPDYTLQAGTPSSFDTHTVIVPPFLDDPSHQIIIEALISTGALPNGTEGFALNIAFKKGAASVDNEPLAINFLDFTQEPDHEWVELINTSDEPVNVANWHLNIGQIYTTESPSYDTHRSEWTIPPMHGTNALTNEPQTIIAPGGTLLLSFDTLIDNFELPPPTLPDLPTDQGIYNNGIGVTRNVYNPTLHPRQGVLADFGANVTVPPIADQSSTGAYPTITGLPAPLGQRRFFDLTGSVFARPGRDFVQTDTNQQANYVDYVDNNGDGVSSLILARAAEAALPETEDDDYAADRAALLALDTDRTLLERDARREDVDGFRQYPYSRIVPLTCDVLFKEDPEDPLSLGVGIERTNDVAMLAMLVLRGGVLPNYPEHDNADNDGDDRYFDEDKGPLRGILPSDMIDNDLNGEIDERHEGIDEGGRMTTPGPDENINWREYGAGSYENRYNDNGVLPVVFYTRREKHSLFLVADTDEGIPFDGSAPLLTEISRLGDNQDDIWSNRNGGPLDFISEATGANTEDALYLGSNYDPPSFKAFNERRWYPGDNVIVTLYDAQRDIIDQATYTEYDVINRTIDDLVTSRYLVDNFGSIGVLGDGNLDDLEDIVALNRDYPSMWLPNQMGLDFYRSLERKHPHYAGDRFGTTNRWQATDGAYDDWAESMSFFELPVRLDPTNNQLPLTPQRLAYPRFLDDHPEPRFDAGINSNRPPHNRRLYGHSVFASPLRENYAARRTENPEDGVLVAVSYGAIPTPPASELYFPQPGDDRQEDPSSPPLVPPQPAQFPAYEYFELADGRGTPAGGLLPLTQNLDWTLDIERTHVSDKAMTNGADLLRVPTMTFEHQMQNPAHPAIGGAIPVEARYLDQMTNVNATYFTGGVLAPGPLPDNASYLSFEPSFRGGMMNYDENDPILGNAFDRTLEAQSTDPIVLTVGQADFTPIRPFPVDLPSSVLPPGGAEALIDYVPGASVSGTLVPGMWSPVFLFEMPGYDNSSDDPEHLPAYPPYFDGRTLPVGNFSVDRLYLFDVGFLFPGGSPGAFSGASANRYGVPSYNGAPAPFTGMTVDQLAWRWPLEKRAVMYVSQIRDSNGNGTMLEAASSAGIPLTRVRPEALFTWDAEDGLENGEYVVYVGTDIPNLGKNLIAAGTAVAGASGNLDTGDFSGEFDVADALLTPQAEIITSKEKTSTNSPVVPFNTRLLLDVITDPTRARGVARASDEVLDNTETPVGGMYPGLISPDDWHPEGNANGARPPSSQSRDGYIMYGGGTDGDWTPIIVRVTNNFLALRVRNMADPRDSRSVAAISHVVLAPRKRVPGKININTVAQTQVKIGNNLNYFNPLLGLPSVVDVAVPDNRAGALSFPIAPDDDVALPNAPAIPNSTEWRDINTLAAGSVVPPLAFPYLDGTTANFNVVNEGAADEAERIAAARLLMSSLMLAGRTQHPDGRYYESVATLAQDSAEYVHPSDPDAGAIHPLSNQRNPQLRSQEIMERFGRMANMLTVRSDVFEIQAVVQSGYGIDLDGDGKFNYRSPDEFVTTGETQQRLVYERRTPSDRSDEARK